MFQNVRSFNQRFGLSLYYDKKTRPAFAQLFTEIFDTIQQVTGEQFKLAPFYPDRSSASTRLCGLAFKYNNPEISQIYTLNPEKLLPCCLKTCNPHFDRHIRRKSRNRSLQRFGPKGNPTAGMNSVPLKLSLPSRPLVGLKADREGGVQENKDSLERQAIQEEMRLDSHRTDLKEQINELRKDVEEERSLRRAWALRCGVIGAELAQLRKGALGGLHIQDRRPDERPSDNESVAPASESNPRPTTREPACTSAANDDMVPVEASDEFMDPYPVIPSALWDDLHGPVPMDTSTNFGAELKAYPTTLLIDSSRTVQDF
ncbi:hypothetical protein B0H13DRAFT_1863225 [Mycena leptocephala]|nr:hypothetical protein B0H13DRAFT_1863225 [Mycena leptocephala]